MADFEQAGATERLRSVAILRDMQRKLKHSAAEALGVEPEASAAEVRSAFMSLTKQYHPAKFARLDEATVRLANEVFLQLREASETLRAAAEKLRPTPAASAASASAASASAASTMSASASSSAFDDAKKSEAPRAPLRRLATNNEATGATAPIGSRPAAPGAGSAGRLPGGEAPALSRTASSSGTASSAAPSSNANVAARRQSRRRSGGTASLAIIANACFVEVWPGSKAAPELVIVWQYLSKKVPKSNWMVWAQGMPK